MLEIIGRMPNWLKTSYLAASVTFSLFFPVPPSIKYIHSWATSHEYETHTPSHSAGGQVHALTT